MLSVVSIRRSMGWLHYYARQPREALEHLRRALAMNPTAEENHRLLGLAYFQLGMYDESAAAYREAVASSESPALATAGLGLVAAAKGRLTDARGILDGLYAESREHYLTPVAFAMLHAGLGESPLHAQDPGRAVGLEVDPRHQRSVEQEREHVVAVDSP